MSTVTKDLSTDINLDTNQLVRPIGVIILSVLLVLWLLLDLDRAYGTTNLILWFVIIFRIMVIIGLLTMARWGYWFTMLYLITQLLFSAPNLSSIEEIASVRGLNSSLFSVRYEILIEQFWVFCVLIIVFIMIFFYLNSRKDFFKY